MLEQLKQAVASRRDEMAELTVALVAIDTENPPGRDYQRCLRFLGERLGDTSAWTAGTRKPRSGFDAKPKTRERPLPENGADVATANLD